MVKVIQIFIPLRELLKIHINVYKNNEIIILQLKNMLFYM